MPRGIQNAPSHKFVLFRVLEQYISVNRLALASKDLAVVKVVAVQAPERRRSITPPPFEEREGW